MMIEMTLILKVTCLAPNETLATITCDEGKSVGYLEDTIVGRKEGETVGAFVGRNDGLEGETEGGKEGDKEGDTVDLNDGFFKTVGATDDVVVGNLLGTAVGNTPGNTTYRDVAVASAGLAE
jgi:hypothetical protein